MNAKQIREITPLRQIKEAGGKSWRAAAWTLERLDPEEYGVKRKSSDSPDQIAELIDRYAESFREEALGEDGEST